MGGKRFLKKRRVSVLLTAIKIYEIGKLKLKKIMFVLINKSLNILNLTYFWRVSHMTHVADKSMTILIRDFFTSTGHGFRITGHDQKRTSHDN
jgi:hypothetical protein